jgi:hypothetical protein
VYLCSRLGLGNLVDLVKFGCFCARDMLDSLTTLKPMLKRIEVVSTHARDK